MPNKQNSTRLPPKTQQKKQAGGKPAKVNIKKILMEEKEAAEGLKENLASLTERLGTLLLSGGVSKALTSDIQEKLLLVHGNDDDTNANLTAKLDSVITSLSEASKAVETAFSYCLCYPSLDVPKIAIVLDELQTVLFESASLANKPLQRKILQLQADPKEAASLAELEGLAKRVNGK